MSWFGGKSKPKEPEPVNDLTVDNGIEFAAPSASSYAPPRSSFQESVMKEQEKLMVQALVLKLTTTSFEKCIERPSSSLSSSEQACVASITAKYLDSSNLVMSKLTTGSFR